VFRSQVEVLRVLSRPEDGGDNKLVVTNLAIHLLSSSYVTITLLFAKHAKKRSSLPHVTTTAAPREACYCFFLLAAAASRSAFCCACACACISLRVSGSMLDRTTTHTSVKMNMSIIGFMMNAQRLNSCRFSK